MVSCFFPVSFKSQNGSTNLFVKNIPLVPNTIQEYDDREFCSPEFEPVFSSFTYVIDASRIMSQNLAINNSKNSKVKPGDAVLAAADAKYVNWFLYLPKCKQQMVKNNGTVDELIFMAVLLINT